MSDHKEEPEEEIKGEKIEELEYSESDMSDHDLGEVIDNTKDGNPERRRRSKRRVKVKTRVRVKKKTDSKKKYKKLVEQLIWVLFIAGFVTALVILYQQLGINDSKYKSNKRTLLLEQYKPSQIAEIQYQNKHNSNSIVMAFNCYCEHF